MMSAPVVSGTVIQATPVDQPTVVTVPPGVSAGQTIAIAGVAPGEEFPHALRWFIHIDSFSYAAKKS